MRWRLLLTAGIFLGGGLQAQSVHDAQLAMPGNPTGSATAAPAAGLPGTGQLENGVATAAEPATPAPFARPARSVADDQPVRLDKMQVIAAPEDDGFDPTGMGSYEQQLYDIPFSNDLISVEAVEDDPTASELASELKQIASPSAVDLATGDSRLNLRGFPTPQLRNGFVRMGVSDTLNTARTIVIQGALVPVLGRAAPGGIQDFHMARPRAQAGKRVQYSLTSLRRQSAAIEVTGPTVPKRAWHRLAMDWNRRTGPEEYAASETRSASGALTWRHSRAASTLFSFDFQQVHATAAPGIPEYRRVTGEKIVGPYLPLAGFNALGPEAGVRRRSATAGVLFDGQPHPKIALRAGVEAWWRQVEQDRFTTSQFNLATQRFDGIREPRHIEQPQQAAVAHVEVTGRFRAFGAEHKLMGAASHTRGEYLREERALPTAARNALPADVRFFDPKAPNYFRPPFSREVYQRVIADRQERVRYTAFEVSDRIGIAKGRAVFTAGLRQDFVGLELEDRRPGAPRPLVTDSVAQLTYHAGVNYQVVRSRMLVFATTSTAFEPSTRVDARTGRVQDNDTTRGYEAGLKARFPKQQMDLTASGFTLFNENISRRNPLYDDPIFDANQTQPQLVAAGEERFSGGKIETRWKPAPPLTLSGRVSYVRAITTASPDLPEEVGRPLTRLPPYTVSASASYGFPKGILKGLSVAASCNYVASYTVNYEDRNRYRRDNPGYGLVSLSASYSLKRGPRTHGFGVAVRNLFDRDLLTTQARMGAGRELSANYRLMF
jgi:iron complex outermembrane recepter protein